MRESYRIAVTGHRNLSDPTTVEFVLQTFRDILTRARREHPAGVVALSGIADGADTLFAQVALSLDLPLEAVIASHGFSRDLPPSPMHESYQYLLDRCRMIHQMLVQDYSDEAYMIVGQWLVDNSDLVVAVWDGQPAAGKGGTGDVVVYAQRVGRPVIHIHAIEHTVRRIEPEPEQTVVNLEEYVLFVEDSARISDRRQMIANIYITINGAVAGLLAFLVKDSGFTNWWLVIAVLPIISFGVMVCRYWRRLILKYKTLINFRLEVLREMETRIPGSARMYHREDYLYPRDTGSKAAGTGGLNFSDMELGLPELFIALYVLLGINLVIGIFLVTSGILRSPIT